MRKAPLIIAALLLVPTTCAAATMLIWGATFLGSTSLSTAAAITTAVSVAGTAASLATIGYSIYTALNRPKQQSAFEGPRMGDLSVQSSARGAPLPKVWGSMRIAGNIIHAKKYEVVTVTEVSSGGKGFMGGGGGGATQTTYTYFADFAISLCEGPITGVRRVWMNNKLWYTAADDASDTELEASEDNERYGKLYLGTTSQNPDPTLEAIHGVGNVPPYRRTAYIVFTRLPLVNFGNAIPQVSVEVCNTPGTFVAPTTICGGDSSGTLASTNMVQDPDTGRVFFTTFSQTYMRVFDSSLECLALITLPGKTSNEAVSTPCYVPTTREIWAPYDTANVGGSPWLWSSIAVIDPDALVVKTNFTIPQTDNGPAFYNPVKDELVVHDHWNATETVYINPHTRAVVSGANLFGSGLCFGCLYLSPHDAIVCWGSDDRIRFVKASDYSLIGDLDATEFDVIHNYVSYDAGRDVLYWCCHNHTNLYTIDLSGLPSAPVLGSARTLPVEPDLGMVYVSSKDTIYVRTIGGDDIRLLDPDTLAETGTIDGLTGTNQGLFAIDGRRFIIAGDRWKVPIRALFANSGVPLAEIVEDLCIGAGLLDDDLDTVQLNTPIVHGYIRASPMQATAALQPLMLAYQFDGVESDYLLHFPKRDGASIATILEDNLGAREVGQEPGPPLAISRQQETDLPTAVIVHIRQPSLSYQQGSQIHRRVYTLSKNNLEIDLPIAASSQFARRLSRRLMNRSWVERTRYQFSLGPEYVYLDPGDIVKVESDNATHLIRLDKVEFGAPGLVFTEGVAQRITLLPWEDEKAQDLDPAPIYEEGEEEDPPDVFPAPVLAPVAQTRLVLLDIPILLDSNDDPGFYYAVAGYAVTGWGGAVLYKSIDSGATYLAHDSMGQPAAIGAATTVLEYGQITIWDGENSVNVLLASGTLASDTADNVLSGKNKAALGIDGRWEIIQWRTATLEVNGSYTLTNLLRGRHGTDHNTANHEIGDTFVALTPTTIDRAQMSIAELQLLRYYKAVSFGLTLTDTAPTTFTNRGIGLTPYSVVHIKKQADVSGDITITWIRRTRAEDRWQDGVDAVLFEQSEAYDVEILNGTQVVRTWTDVTTTSQLYTVAQQTTDFGAAQDVINVRVFQKSATVGRGFPWTAQLSTTTPQINPPSTPPAGSPPAPIGGLKTAFPRLGRTTYGSPHNYGNANFQGQLARVDVVLMAFHFTWGSSASINSAVNAIKAINSDIKLLNYLIIEVVSPSKAGQAALKAQCDAQNWWLRANGTSGGIVVDTGGYGWKVNLSNFCPTDGTNRWNTWIAEYENTRLFSLVSGLDGVFIDNVFFKPRINGDWNRDGTSDSQNSLTVHTWFREGMKACFDRFKSLMPTKYVTGNVGDWQRATVAMPEYDGQLHGGLLEGYIGHSWSPEGIDMYGVNNGWGSWTRMMTGYRSVIAQMAAPKALIFNMKGKRTDYKSFRYGFASCLMDEAYFDFSDGEAGIYASYVLWFDEYDLAGTANTNWLGTAVDTPPLAAWQNGVWRRRFTGGMVLVNPRGNGAQVVTIESGYRRFVGTQDPVTNNGSLATSFSIPDRDGLFLKIA
jgi:Putative phage tail protein/Hypothetical glycosyl hydrolase family 15